MPVLSVLLVTSKKPWGASISPCIVCIESHPCFTDMCVSVTIFAAVYQGTEWQPLKELRLAFISFFFDIRYEMRLQQWVYYCVIKNTILFKSQCLAK